MYRLVILGVLLAAAPSAMPAQAVDYLEKGNDHYFNLEYDEAIAAYYQAMQQRGEDAGLWNHIATSFLYKELHRLGKLDSSAFRGENTFLGEEKPQPDPKNVEKFLGALFQARRLAQAELQKDPRDTDALLALSANHGLQANYEFMVEKSYFAALRNGTQARKYSDQLMAVAPDLADAYLVPGVQEYVVGSLPWVVKVLASLGGFHGSKKKGEEWVARTARDGKSMRNEARVLLTLLYRRENRPLEAVKVLEQLSEEYPRNYVIRLELGAMYLDAGEKPRAMEIFRNAQRMVRTNENRFGRMPERYQKALQRRIETLEKAEPAGSARAGSRVALPSPRG